MKKVLSTLAVALFISTALPVFADEINYGSLKDQRGDTLLIEYKSPAGARYYTCDVAADCTYRGTTTPELFPSVLGSRVYETSGDGRLAVRQFTLGTKTFYFLYDISGTKPVKRAVLPYSMPGAKVSISANNSAVVFKDGLTYTRYDIATKKLSKVSLAQPLSFVTISPDARYIAGYNYGRLRHEVWSVADGGMRETPSSMQSYLEFSEDERFVAFLEDVDGFKTLFTMETAELGTADPDSLVQLTEPETETEDYLYVEDTLYFLANTKGPLAWDLWSYDGDDTQRIETSVSYGDYLKRVRMHDHSYLAYLKTSGKNTDLMLLSSNPGEKTALAPIEPSPLHPDVIVREKRVANRTGVLMSPKEPARDAALFIWLHGGPQRQVALGYHPYLSYAVYDELLERLTAAGHYVYKLDYIGSSGYGAAFRKALHLKIGDVEMRDVERAIEELRDTLDTERIYLIGNSYGGYMALRGIVDMPETLDGVISINGVADWYGLISRIPSSPFAALFNGVPDTHNLSAYFKASVYLGMEDLTKDDKVLVVWGENDSTVPVWQSEQYVAYANEQGVNVEALSFPDEDHILRGRDTLDALCLSIREHFDVRNLVCEL